jgi:hypothetical protein
MRFRNCTLPLKQYYAYQLWIATIFAVNTEQFKSRVSALVNISLYSTFVQEVD